MARVLETDTYLQPISLQSQLISGQSTSEFVRPWTISSCPKDNPRYYVHQNDPSSESTFSTTCNSRNCASQTNKLSSASIPCNNSRAGGNNCAQNEPSSSFSCLPTTRRSSGQCHASSYQRPTSGDPQQLRQSSDGQRHLPPGSPCDAACDAGDCQPSTPSCGSRCGNFAAASPSGIRDAAQVSPLKAAAAISMAAAAQANAAAQAQNAVYAEIVGTSPRCSVDRRKKKDPVSTSPRSRSIEEMASPSSPINRNFSFQEQLSPQQLHLVQKSPHPQHQHALQNNPEQQYILQNYQHHPQHLYNTLLPTSQSQQQHSRKSQLPKKLEFPRLDSLVDGHLSSAFNPASFDTSQPFPPALNISKISSAAGAATQSCARERLVPRPTLPPLSQQQLQLQQQRVPLIDDAHVSEPSESMSETTSDARSVASNQTEEERLHVAKTWVFDPDALFKNTHMIRVSQLNKTTSMETFYAYFSKFGKISDCKLLLRDFVKVYDSEDPRRSIDFKVVGEVYYDQEWAARAFHAIFGVKNHVLDSHALQISLLFPPMFTTSLALQDNRVFIGGIAVSAKYQVANLTNYLNALFSQYGDIFHVKASFFSSSSSTSSSSSPSNTTAASAVVTFRDASSANAAVRTAKTAWNVKLLASMVAEVDEPYPMWV